MNEEISPIDALKELMEEDETTNTERRYIEKIIEKINSGVSADDLEDILFKFPSEDSDFISTVEEYAWEAFGGYPFADEELV